MGVHTMEQYAFSFSYNTIMQYNYKTIIFSSFVSVLQMRLQNRRERSLPFPQIAMSQLKELRALKWEVKAKLHYIKVKHKYYSTCRTITNIPNGTLQRATRSG
jgi:hypothetical protein